LEERCRSERILSI